MIQGVLACISLIIAVTAVLTVIARLIKQPPIIAYLLAGIVVGPLILNLIGPDSSSMIQTLAHVGVAFLLFIVGLSLDLRVLKEVGKVSSLAGIIEVCLTSGVAFLIALGIGFSNITALYLGIALAFSSTVVVVKILSDKKEIDTLHGRIALGILIVEDFIAAIVLMTVPLLYGGSGIVPILKELGLAVAVVFIIFMISHFILNKFLNYLARSQEALFLFGIAWALVLATIFELLGFSLEIGALVAGMSLASSQYNLELGGKIKPLRDFFVVLFFVYFGSQLTATLNWELITNALIFSAFIFLGKPVIVMSVLRIFGYKKKTNFLAGSSLAQISEFSLIITMAGYTMGYISNELLSLVILIAIITIGLSSYSIYYSHFIFNKISRALNIFEKDEYMKNEKEKSFEIILFGYHRIGFKILEELKKTKHSFVVVDYNPKVVLALNRRGIKCIFGDASDKEFLNEIKIEKAKLIISTIPDEASNYTIAEKLREISSKTVFLATTEQPRKALDLYSKGVDYVIVPHHIGGEFAAKLIEDFSFNKEKYREVGKKHIKELRAAKNNSSF